MATIDDLLKSRHFDLEKFYKYGYWLGSGSFGKVDLYTTKNEESNKELPKDVAVKVFERKKVHYYETEAMSFFSKGKT